MPPPFHQDILTPTADGEELVERIPGADLSIISGAAHGFPVEHALAFNKLVLEFLAAGIDESADA